MKFVIHSIGQTITIIHAVADLGPGGGGRAHPTRSGLPSSFESISTKFQDFTKNTNSLIFLCSLAFSPAFQGRVGTLPNGRGGDFALFPKNYRGT